MKPRTVRTVKLVLIGVSLLLLVSAATYVAMSETSMQRAETAHHAEPPQARTALQSYHRVMQRPYDPRSTRAMYQAATIYDHGVLQGREPVLPDRPRAIGFYRQVAVVGPPLERALARERLVELGDRVFENPPPRRHFPLQALAAPVVAAHEAADVVHLMENPGLAGTVRSDSQNVHDSSVVKSIKLALEKLGPSSIPLEKTAVEVRSSLGQDEDALKGLDLVETNTVPLSALKMTESEVLRRVWGRIREEPDELTQKNMQTMLKLRLAESGKEASCASGRVARIVDALSTFVESVNLRPVWVLRREMMAKAAALRKNQDANNETKPLREILREHFKRDYVDPGLTTMSVVDAELESWGTDIA